MSIRARVEALGLVLPELTPSKGNYNPWKISRGFCYISGQSPPVGTEQKPSPYRGLIGQTVSLDVAIDAAMHCGLKIIAQANQALEGDFERIAGVVRLCGFVAGTSSFEAQHLVVNGASKLMVELLGERGRHTRTAVGVSSLPLGACVQIEALFELT